MKEDYSEENRNQLDNTTNALSFLMTFLLIITIIGFGYRISEDKKIELEISNNVNSYFKEELNIDTQDLEKYEIKMNEIYNVTINQEVYTIFINQESKKVTGVKKEEDMVIK